MLPACLLLTALLVGCASAPGERSRTVLAESRSGALVILPLNVVAVMPPELEASAPVVWGEIEDYLRDQGLPLKTLAIQTARRFWVESIREARAGPEGSRPGFDEANRIFVGKLTKHANFDTVALPSLVETSVAVADRTAIWDGVRRTIELEGPPPGTFHTGIEAKVPAASLYVVVLDAEGRKVHENKGGLALLARVRVHWPPGEAGGENIFRLVPEPEPFANRGDVREGVARAFAPFLSPPSERDAPSGEAPRPQ